MPKILYIGAFEKVWDEEGIARSLETWGCEVIRMEELGFMYDQFIRVMEQEKPDCVLWAKLKLPQNVANGIIEKCKSKDVMTVCWIPDLYWGLTRQWHIGVVPFWKADYVCTPDGADRDWKKVNHHVLRQGIYHEMCYMAEPKERKDIVFVGSINGDYPYRTKMIKHLKTRYGGRFYWKGHTSSDDVRGDDLNQLYADARVIIGESVYAPYYWSNRIYETLGRGGFMVHPWTEGIDEEYREGKDFFTYRHDLEELTTFIDTWMEKDTTKVRKSALQHTKKHHTLLHRAKQFLEITGLITSCGSPEWEVLSKYSILPSEPSEEKA